MPFFAFKQLIVLEVSRVSSMNTFSPVCAQSQVNFRLIQQSGEYCQLNIRIILYCVVLSGRDYIYVRGTVYKIYDGFNY